MQNDSIIFPFFDSTINPFSSNKEVEIKYCKNYRVMIYNVELTSSRIEECPHCHSKVLHVHRIKEIRLNHISTHTDLIQLRVTYKSYRCAKCRRIITEEIPYRVGRSRYTNYYKQQCIELMKENGMTLKKAAEIMKATPKLMKDIKKEYLAKLAGDLKPKHYSSYILIDEFLLEHPHRYCTIVIDAETTELLYLEKGKSKAQVQGFMDFVGEDFMNHVKAVGMDMNNTYYNAIHEKYKHIDICYDRFHIIKWYNEKVTAFLRKSEYKSLKKVAEAAKASGDCDLHDRLIAEAEKMFNSRFLLMSNRKTLAAKDEANRILNTETKERYNELGIAIPDNLKLRREDNLAKLQDILGVNENISTCYNLVEELKDILRLRDAEKMENDLKAWIATAKAAKISQLSRFVKTIEKRWDGIIGIAKHGISSGRLEGLNNYIKNLRRSSFGFLDFDFFGLLIWEHTHNKAKWKASTNTQSKRTYKRTSKTNVMRASKQTIYIVERDKNGKIINDASA